MPHARLTLATVTVVLLAGSGVLTLGNAKIAVARALQFLWDALPHTWPDLPFGALIFVSVSGWLLMRKRRRHPTAGSVSD